jgi:Fe-S-cluster containining protein
MSNRYMKKEKASLNNKKGDIDAVITTCFMLNSPGSNMVLARDIPCDHCGECCKDENVGLSLTDIVRISKHLNISPGDFVDKYCLYTVVDDGKGKFSMIGLNTMDGCPFHADNKCSIQEVKPLIFRMFPIIDCSNTRADFIQFRDGDKHPHCAIHKMDPKMLIVPDMDTLVDLQISSGAQLEYSNKAGIKTFNARIFDGMYHKELMAGKNKTLRQELLDDQMTQMGTYFGELLRMDAAGEKVSDLGKYEKPFTETFEK